MPYVVCLDLRRLEQNTVEECKAALQAWLDAISQEDRRLDVGLVR